MIHDLRHTAASWAIRRGTPLEVVQAMLGHTTIATTQRYAHHAPSAVDDAIEKLGEILR